MRGLPHSNFPAFKLAASILRSVFDFEIVNPAEMDEAVGQTSDDWDHFTPAQKDAALRDAAARDLAEVSQCRVVFLLPGWERSRLGFIEVMLAVELGLKIIEITDLTSTGLRLRQLTYEEVYVRTRPLHRPRSVPSMWLARQLSSIQGRLREMLRNGLRLLGINWGKFVYIPNLNRYEFVDDIGNRIQGTVGPMLNPSLVREVGLWDRRL